MSTVNQKEEHSKRFPVLLFKIFVTFCPKFVYKRNFGLPENEKTNQAYEINERFCSSSSRDGVIFLQS